MKLRKLELKDAPFMLEWMHDPDVVKDLHTDFSRKTLGDAKGFIRSSWDDTNNVHLAIASDEDEYMGTVSLKAIRDGTAEFAITVRSCAMGKGYSWFGMDEILHRALTDYGLKAVYWCVSVHNKRAVRFYDKHAFRETASIPLAMAARYDGVEGLKWYLFDGEDISGS